MLNDKLYGDTLRRLDLLKIPYGSKQISISVYRNHSFEIISNVINAFLSESNYKATFFFSDYDDSLNFSFRDADIQLIWIDTNRYNKLIDLVSFFKERVGVLRSQTNAPILIAYTGDNKLDLNDLTTDCFSLFVPDYINSFDNPYDLKKEPFSGTRLSSKACLEVARVLGLRYIPAILDVPIKAIIVDLDNTLYEGILGEDGVNKLIPNLDLQRQLKEYKSEGVFLCIASKNEENDVKKMFIERSDFVLHWDDFTTSQVNWNSKSDNIIKIAEILNIALDSILFIDDNPAEIQNVEHLGIKTVLAKSNVSKIMKYYPGLLRLRKSNEDLIRSKDIQANIQRAKLFHTLSNEEYFEKLGIKLEYSINAKSQCKRISELLNKTNQFILSYIRYNESQVRNFILLDPNNIVITIKMSDNLSDSGIIAICLATKKSENLFVKELVVSCRALGRHLEDIMLPYMLNIAKNKLNCSGYIDVAFKKGERNQPAINWLSKYSSENLSDEGTVTFDCKNVSLKGLIIEVIDE